MSLLIKNSMPAERAVSCSFAELNRNAAEVEANGGTLVGSPTFDADGIVLDGLTQYSSYDLTGSEFSSSKLSIVCEFWPDFETDEDSTRYIYSTKETARDYSLFKLANTNNNVLFVTLGGSSIGSILEVVYKPYWKVNQRNVVQISSNGASTDVWLNGVKVMDADPTVWAPKKQNTMYLGSSITGGTLFKGKIGQVKVFKSLLTAQDAVNFYDNTTYTYPQRALVDLPLQACQHDPDSVRTLDISGNGNHATFGDGVTPSMYPTKLQKRGYSFDGGDYAPVLNSVAGGHDFTDINICTFGILAKATADFSGNGGAWRALMTVAELRAEGVSDGTNLSIYVNGKFENSNADTNDESVGGSPANYFIGSRTTDGGGPINYFSGNLYDHLFCPFALTPLQIADWHLNALKRINRV